MDFSKKQAHMVLFAVTLGNLLEWYEIYLFVYWAPVIAELFFDGSSPLSDLTNTFFIFAIGFLARPLGGIFFGRLGDRIGRRKALIISLLMMTIPTFITGLLPTRMQIGALAPWALLFLRLLQSFPAGGELPGAMCYLYESSRLANRRYFSSWASIGFQMGILLSTLESLMLENVLPSNMLASWGWRISFILGGVIGLFGLYLRSKLHETPLYKEMISHEVIVKESLFTLLSHYKKKILLSMMFCVLNSSAFYLITVNISEYFADLLGLNYRSCLLTTALCFFSLQFPFPCLGNLRINITIKKWPLVLQAGSSSLSFLYTLPSRITILFFYLLRLFSFAFLSRACQLLYLIYSLIYSLRGYDSPA
jgi:MFS transporter, MHS family, proline/betaine transporter